MSNDAVIVDVVRTPSGRGKPGGALSGVHPADLLGITTGRMAKFVKRYADVHGEMVRGVGQYVDEVRSRHFPEPDHVYGVEPAELDELRRYLDQESLTSQKAWDWEPLP